MHSIKAKKRSKDEKNKIGFKQEFSNKMRTKKYASHRGNTASGKGKNTKVCSSYFVILQIKAKQKSVFSFIK